MATTIASGSRHDLVIVQGATFVKKFLYQDNTKSPISLTGYGARMLIKEDPSATAALLTLTTDNGRITLNTPTSGSINIKITAEDTDELTFYTGVYDLELYYMDGQEEVVDNIIYGNVSVRRSISKTQGI